MDDYYDRVNLSCSVTVKEKTSAYMVNIPAFNIHFYVKNRQEIEKSAHESLVSFFNYWIHKRNPGNFFQHLSNLGFSFKTGVSKVAEPTTNYARTTQVVIDRLIFS